MGVVAGARRGIVDFCLELEIWCLLPGPVLTATTPGTSQALTNWRHWATGGKVTFTAGHQQATAGAIGLGPAPRLPPSTQISLFAVRPVRHSPTGKGPCRQHLSSGDPQKSLMPGTEYTLVRSTTAHPQIVELHLERASYPLSGYLEMMASRHDVALIKGFDDALVVHTRWASFLPAPH